MTYMMNNNCKATASASCADAASCCAASRTASSMDIMRCMVSIIILCAVVLGLSALLLRHSLISLLGIIILVAVLITIPAIAKGD